MTQISLVEFNYLYRKNYPRVRKIVFKHGFKDSQADDIIQESFITAWEKRSTLKKVEAFGGWIRTIARNHCMLVLRARQVTASLAPSDGGDDDAPKSRMSEEALVHGGYVEPDRLVANLELEHSLLLLSEVIKGLKLEPRATIGRMYYLEEASVKTISGRLSIKQNTILSHLRRFRIEVTHAMRERVAQEELCV